MNPLDLFRQRRRSRAAYEAHMTWATTSMGRTVTRTRLFLRKRLWIWPIIAIVFLSLVGFAVRSAIESTMKSNLASGLGTLLEVETAMLETWLRLQAHNAESMANDAQTRQLMYQLLDDSDAGDAVQQSPERLTIHKNLANELGPGMSAHDYLGYFLADESQKIVSSSSPSLAGLQRVPEYRQFLSRALEGEKVVSSPFASVVPLENEDGRMWTGVPVMYVAAPVRDEKFQVVGALAFRVDPQREFTRILQFGRLWDSGETYAFDHDGVMVSNSRFDEQLILAGLLPDLPHTRSMLNIQVRDPQGNVPEGYRASVRRSEMPLTRMAADAVQGNSGVDVEGYRDYRGVPVVGAWRWLPEYDIGVATEVDVAEAFRPLAILRTAFWSLYSLLILCSVAIFVFTVAVARANREARRAAIEAQQLGQYTLEKKVGAGAMGIVYRGHHAMLRRPAAIKMLDVDKVNEVSIARFEREVQITCQLNHPNTIAIYDYGRTPEGVFYYAMEYLDGIDLESMVEQYGPQPEARVIKILLQICGSLYEAHSQNLVHRDIKPANVMLNHRGGVPDFVKVLDFGLVKAVDDTQQARATSAGALMGTPLYMSPEAIQAPLSVDARSDIYAVGAVGYFLLTGLPVFDASSIVELCQKHVDETPIAPARRVSIDLSSELEDALLACLDKSRAKRPQTARDLAKLMRKSPAADSWSIEDGDAWWGRHQRSTSTPPVDQNATETKKSEVALDHTIDAVGK